MADAPGPASGARPQRLPHHSASQHTSTASGSFFRACILLLLSERSAHGYDLLERLTEFGFDSGDSGWLYRTLRAFERGAVVDSTWEISASGPPRRVYNLTSDGHEQLDAWATSLRASKWGIDEFLDRHGRAPRPGPRRG